MAESSYEMQLTIVPGTSPEGYGFTRTVVGASAPGAFSKELTTAVVTKLVFAAPFVRIE
jgi:hypothetical protein